MTETPDFMKIMSVLVCDYNDPQSIADFHQLDIVKDDIIIKQIMKDAEVFFS